MLQSLMWLTAALLGSAALEKSFLQNAKRQQKGAEVRKAATVILSRRNCRVCHLIVLSFTTVSGSCHGRKAVIYRRPMNNESPSDAFIRTRADGGGEPLDLVQELMTQGHGLLESNPFCSCLAQL